MRPTTAIQALHLIGLALICLIGGTRSLAGSAKDGQGSLTVSPTSVAASSTNSFAFRFRTPKSAFNPGSQATIQIPAGWSAPQTNSGSGTGFVTVSPVLSSSTASLISISGSGPWTLTINFSSSQNQGGFSVGYNGAVAPANAGIYSFQAQSKQSGGKLRTLRSGGPTVTVNSLSKTNTTTTLSSGLNPSTYGDWVTFTASVSSGATAVPTGTVAFKEGDVLLGTVTLGVAAPATFSTNRFVVFDSPCSITAEYSGDAMFNPSVSTVLLQTVNPATLTVTGLAAQDKVYDGGTVATLDLSNVNLSGALAGDDVAVDSSAAAASFADPNVGALKTVNVAGLGLLGADSGNYVIGPLPSISGDILPATLVVTANNTNRFFGFPNPAFTATYAGFVAGEDARVLTGAPTFSTSATATSPVADSPYPIAVTNGTLTASNYSFTFVPGLLTIVPAPAQPQRIVSMAILPDGTASIECSGAAGQTYWLQASADVLSPLWANVATNTTDTNGFMTCLDPAATNTSTRFYRTALP